MGKQERREKRKHRNLELCLKWFPDAPLAAELDWALHSGVLSKGAVYGRGLAIEHERELSKLEKRG